MNTIIKTPIILLLLSIATFTNLSAKGDSLYVDFLCIQPFKYIVSYNNADIGSNTLLKIVDDEGRLLLTNSFQGSIKKIYNFQELLEGNYKIVFENEQNRMIQPLTKGKMSVILESSKQKLINYPLIKEEPNNKVSVDLSKFNFNEKVKLIFEDLPQDYQEFYPLDESKKYIFSLENLPKGNYEIRLAVGNKIINRKITI